MGVGCAYIPSSTLTAEGARSCDLILEPVPSKPLLSRLGQRAEGALAVASGCQGREEVLCVLAVTLQRNLSLL